LIDYATITTAAIEIADRDGLDAATMRAIAANLGRAPMSLYRHIGNRDDLTELMYDAALGELSTDGNPSAGWRENLTDFLRDFRALYLRHPWVINLGQRPTLGPNSVRLLEYSLSCVDEPGRTVDQMMDILSTTMQFTIGFVRDELGEREAQARTGIDAEGWHEFTTGYVMQLIAEGTHPYFERFIREAEDFPEMDAVFDRRLALVLAGVATAAG
jgi:AcrR family transcriptional regulator